MILFKALLIACAALVVGCSNEKQYGTVSDAIIDIVSLRVPQRATSGVVQGAVKEAATALSADSEDPEINELLTTKCHGKEGEASDGLAVQLLIDHSKSIFSDEQRAKALRAVPARLYSALRDTDEFGVIAFSNEPKVVLELAPVESRVRSEITAYSQEIKVGGSTAVLPALLEAANALFCSRSARKAVVILSDLVSKDEEDIRRGKELKNLYTALGLSLIVVKWGEADLSKAVKALLGEPPHRRESSTSFRDGIAKAEALLGEIGKEGVQSALVEIKAPAISLPEGAELWIVDSLSILKYPRLDAEVLGSVKAGAKVVVLSIKDGWAEVLSRSGKRGYFPKAYLRERIKAP